MAAPSPSRPPPPAELLARMANAPLEVLGRMPWSSNGTYLVELADGILDTSYPAPLDSPGPDGPRPGTDRDGSGSPADDRDSDDWDDDAVEDPDEHDGGTGRPSGPGGVGTPGATKAIYKPGRHERPLWDFPSGLYRREAAAYELGAALGWYVVPPTIVRDGPLGEGSLQLFVDADFAQHYFTLQDEACHQLDFQAICALDLVANNTDRKSGHCLLGPDKRIWAIDNGLCFAEEFKLRTVIWEFAGLDVPAPLLADLVALAERGLPSIFDDLLDADERRAAHRRLGALVEAGSFPVDRSGHRYPWPLV